jgi:hypothetical protein
MAFGRAKATVGEIEEKGLGWAAWMPNLYCVAVEPLRLGLVFKSREGPGRWETFHAYGL